MAEALFSFVFLMPATLALLQTPSTFPFLEFSRYTMFLREQRFVCLLQQFSAAPCRLLIQLCSTLGCTALEAVPGPGRPQQLPHPNQDAFETHPDWSEVLALGLQLFFTFLVSCLATHSGTKALASKLCLS